VYEYGGGTGLTPPNERAGPAAVDGSRSPPPPPFGQRAPASAPPPAEHHSAANEDDGDGAVDAGWSDDEFDFDDDHGGESESESEEVITIAATPCPAPAGPSVSSPAPSTRAIRIPAVSGVDPLGTQRRRRAAGSGRMDATPSSTAVSNGSGTVAPPPRERPEDDGAVSVNVAPPPPSRPSFDDEYVVVLKDRIETESAAAEKTGRLRRWDPISEDPVLGRRLVGAMVAQLGYSQ